MATIGVIGLKPRQISDIAEMTADGRVQYYDRETITPDSVRSFARKMDYLVVLTNHTPKSVHHLKLDIPVEHVRGPVGISTVKSTVRGILAREFPQEAATVTQSVDTTVETAPSVQDEAIPLDWRESFLVLATTGYRPVPDSDVVVVPANEAGHRFTALAAGRPGDILRVYSARTTKTANVIAAKQLAVYYGKKIGYRIEIHVYTNHIDYYVTDSPRTDVRQRLIRVDRRDMMLAALKLKPAMVPEHVEVPAAAETPSVATGANPDFTPIRLTGDAEVDYWKELVLAGVRNGKSADAAVVEADIVLTALRNRS